MFGWDDKWFWVFAIGLFIASATMGASVTSVFYEGFKLLPKDFQCTESSIVNGSAECVRYERREK